MEVQAIPIESPAGNVIAYVDCLLNAGSSNLTNRPRLALPGPSPLFQPPMGHPSLGYAAQHVGGHLVSLLEEQRCLYGAYGRPKCFDTLSSRRRFGS